MLHILLNIVMLRGMDVLAKKMPQAFNIHFKWYCLVYKISFNMFLIIVIQRDFEKYVIFCLDSNALPNGLAPLIFKSVLVYTPA